MGKIKFGNLSVDPTKEHFEGEVKEYLGPTPTGKGPWRSIMKRMELTKTKDKGDPMLVLLFELAAKKGDPNEKYNGYGVWHRLNITDQGAKYVNAFLAVLTDGSEAAIAKIENDFYGGKLIIDGDDEGHVERIGSKNINSPDCEIPVWFVGKKDTYQGEDKLAVRRFLQSAAAEEAVSDRIEDAEPLEELPEEDLPEEEAVVVTKGDDDDGEPLDDEPPF